MTKLSFSGKEKEEVNPGKGNKVVKNKINEIKSKHLTLQKKN